MIVIGWDRTGAYNESEIKYEFVHPVNISENPIDAKGILIYFQQYYHMFKCFITLMKPMWKLRNNYDYVHNFNSGFAFNRVSIFIAKVLGKKVITETSLIGDDDPLSLGRFKDWKDYLKPKFVRYQFYKMADRFVSKSEVMTEIFERSEIPMNKVVEIPYSVDTFQFCPVPLTEKNELRKKLGIWEDGMIVLFVGGINFRKGVHILVDAFIKIEKKYPDLKLLIVGPTYKYDPEYINEIKNKIKENGFSNKIRLTEKNVSNVDEYMKCADIFVLPSKQEGFPISIIEAMSSGLGVIGSDIPEIAKAQIENGKDGYTFTTGDSWSLAETIEKLICDKEKFKEIITRARNKAVENWSASIIDKKYKEVYSSI